MLQELRPLLEERAKRLENLAAHYSKQAQKRRGMTTGHLADAHEAECQLDILQASVEAERSADEAAAAKHQQEYDSMDAKVKAAWVCAVHSRAASFSLWGLCRVVEDCDVLHSVSVPAWDVHGSLLCTCTLPGLVNYGGRFNVMK